MAYKDYVHCASDDPNCKGHKLIYTGDRYWDEEPPRIYCAYCYDKLLKKISRLEKQNKRKR